MAGSAEVDAGSMQDTKPFADFAVFMVMSVAVGTCAIVGCSRQQYRVDADRDAELLISERTDPQFFLPDRDVEPASHSRLADLSDPDCGPLPPDDSAARRFMDRPYRAQRASIWQERGELPFVEFDHWQQYLPTDDAGTVRLNRNTSMELALLHSRRYQTFVEGVYLQALPVSLERFQFDTQWVGGGGFSLASNGLSTSGATRAVTLNDQLGLRRRFATGGQLLADFSNAMVWEFNGDTTSAASLLSFQFLQPLMRRAFREVQLESLTQAERNLLYGIRDFARFRREFYLDTIGTGGYLGLLAVAQAIRNAEANLESLRRNREEHEALQEAGLVSQFQIDQVYQDYQEGRLSVLEARASFNTALDAYKLQLGLPPTMAAILDSEELQQFELNDPRLEQLTDSNAQIRLELLQYSEESLPSIEELRAFHAACQATMDEIPARTDDISAELNEWKMRLAAEDSAVADSEDEYRRKELAQRLGEIMQEMHDEFPDDLALLANAGAAIDREERLQAWQALTALCGKTIRARLADLFVIQTQVRVFLIQIAPVEITETTALWLAHTSRLDLKNELAGVVDAYRRTEVAADLLEADLDLALQADLGTDAGRSNPVRFDASSSRLSAGLQFDGPLNRMAERNIYRSRQIEYQQARRRYMAAKDQISFDVRNNLRNLNLNRIQFEIARQQLITAARQVEQAQFELRNSSEPDSNKTRDLLTALQVLLQARNSLIANWVSYESSRMQLHVTLGILQVDDGGNWVNDRQPFEFDVDALVDEQRAEAEPLL